MFEDRKEAGKKLAQALLKYKNDKSAVVFAVPRGGVVVAEAVCEYLQIPLDVVVARKIGAPFNEELAIGAVSPDGDVIINEEAVRVLKVSESYLMAQKQNKINEIKERLKKYRGSDVYESLEGRTAIIVDDGIATGYTVKAAVDFIRGLNAERVVVASPVIAPDTLVEFEGLVDEVVYIYSDEPFYAVGQFYKFFPQISDEEVISIIKKIKGKGE
ncbi:Predicted phosphoribosyltransferase [Caldanaerovirga acetigignens]|uniref:Predicted phosphoribosyltransferase n=1 Tax=Caldanaerovirga acetigignens TaxID=447595 RepID=A0A1M7JS78_9FIRM|nr:Predicted phosphoribosyltransferase [Caldanaerovirga acetigignens]